MLGMALVLDPVQEVAELTAKVARLPQPQDAPPRELARPAADVAWLRGGRVSHGQGQRLFEGRVASRRHRTSPAPRSRPSRRRIRRAAMRTDQPGARRNARASWRSPKTKSPLARPTRAKKSDRVARTMRSALS